MEKDNEKENVCDTANQSLPFMDEKIEAESNSVFILFMPKGESALVILCVNPLCPNGFLLLVLMQ